MLTHILSDEHHYVLTILTWKPKELGLQFISYHYFLQCRISISQGKFLSKIQLHFYCCFCPLQLSGFELRNGGDADKWTKGGKSLLTDSVR